VEKIPSESLSTQGTHAMLEQRLLKSHSNLSSTTKHWKTHRPSRKLADQASGLYRIIERVEHAYRLHLPDSIRVHAVFAPEKLHLARRTW
jgi:hypothetical protein